ncbi:MAG: hypothetical protein IPM37_19155 [Hahellaceae bacterium]|nr:hypothetical protein [Hahellaceae bacterium]
MPQLLAKRNAMMLVLACLLLTFATYSGIKCFKVADQRLLGEVNGIGTANAHLIKLLLNQNTNDPVNSITSDAIPSAAIELVNRLRFRQLGHAFLINETSTIIAHPIAELVDKKLSEEFKGDFTLNDQLQPVTSSIGKRLLAFFPLNAPGAPNWYLVADINGTEAYDSRRYAAYAGLSLFVAGLLLGLGLRRS